jgi:membrane fusion protein, multidrug efflux system
VKSSNIIAAAIVVLVSLWMLSGITKSDEIKIEAEAEPVHKLARVQVQHYQAEPMQREIIVQGQSQAKREVTVKVQTNGQVKQVLADKGTAVKRGSVVLKLADDARPLQLEEARSLVAQRSLEYEAAKKLKSKNLQTERQVAEAMTLLNSAKTQLKNAELNMARQNVIAPFAGLIQARHAELGDYLQLGDPAYTLITLDPLVLKGDVSENEVDRLRLDQSANVELSNGAKITGKLRYIAAMADSNTRTYAIEVEASNTDLKQRAGMSATIRIPLDSMPAHKVSPALLSLNDEGELGLKIVDDDSVVRFYTVELLKSERDGLWLGGLPQSMDLIIVGQGFVRDGDKVEIAREKEAS